MKKAIKSDIQNIMTDQEVCDLLRISRVTLRSHLTKKGPPKGRYKDKNDIRLVRHFKVGGKRRWFRDSVEKFMRGDL